MARSTPDVSTTGKKKSQDSTNSVKPPLNVPSAIGLTLTPILAVILVPWYGYSVGFSLYEWSIFAFYMVATGLSITAGYHRLWSHKTYEAHPVVRVFLAVWGACALQNSILHWASDHRRHHRHVDDEDSDPYAASRGFWFSHIGWILRQYKTGIDDFSNVKDLMRDPVVAWQHKHYKLIATATNVLLPLMLGLLVGKLWGVLLLAGLLRLVLNHHFTFSINSLAHIWGSQPYCDQSSARDNGLLACLTYGEGYHNYHHRFQYDYRNGIHWWHFDPAKWLIRLLSLLGLAKGLKRPSPVQIQKARLAMQYQRALQRMEERRDNEAWREGLENAYQKFLSLLDEFNKVQQEWRQLRREQIRTTIEGIDLQRRYADLRSALKTHRRQWRMLTALAKG